MPERCRSLFDLDEILKAASKAWRSCVDQHGQVLFAWRGRVYRSDLDNLRIRVQTLDGRAVTCWFHV